MHLIASPLQKQFYTYLPKSPIFKKYSVADLPISYHNLANRQNGGYTSQSYIPTNKPSRDALNAVYIPYISGMFEQKTQHPYQIPSLTRQNDFVHRPNITDDGIIFYEDHDRVAYFDFGKMSVPNQPSVAYIDFGIGQEITLAPTFDAFLDLFETRQLGNPAPTLVSQHRVNAAILRAHSYTEIDHLLDHFGQILGKDWQNAWKKFMQNFDNQPFAHFQDVVRQKSQQRKV